MTLARHLAALAVRIAPPDRRVWAQAIEAELEFVSARSATGFALGGLLAALRMRLAHPPLVLGVARYGLAAAALGWSALHVRLALHLHAEDPSLPAALPVLSAVVFSLGAVITALGGLRLTAILSVPALGLVIASAMAAGVLVSSPGPQAFYYALALEDAFALLVAMLVALAARRYAAVLGSSPG